MRGLLCLVLCCVVGVQVTLAESGPGFLPPYQLRTNNLQPTNGQSLGPISVHSTVGVLPAKYTPLSYDDVIATHKAAELFPELLQIFPELDVIDTVEPIKIHDLWLRGILYLNNIKVEGIRQTQLENLEIRTGNNRVDFTTHIPRLTVTVDFRLESFVGLWPVFLSGTLTANANDFKLVGAFGATVTTLPQHGDVYQVDSADADVFINDLDIHSNPPINHFAYYLDKIRDKENDIADIVLGALLKKVNNELLKVSAFTIDKYLNADVQQPVPA